MTGDGARVEDYVGLPPLESLVDPVVRLACRALARLSYPARDLAELPNDQGGALVRSLLTESDLPLASLREALSRLDQRLQAPPPPPVYESPTAPFAPVPELLAGDEPEARAARAVYRGVSRDPALRHLGEEAVQRLAFVRALDFRALCEAAMPDDLRSGGAGLAARHAWAQCYAREYLAMRDLRGPSPCCDQAARLAASLAERAADSFEDSDLAD